MVKLGSLTVIIKRFSYVVGFENNNLNELLKKPLIILYTCKEIKIKMNISWCSKPERSMLLKIEIFCSKNCEKLKLAQIGAVH